MSKQNSTILLTCVIFLAIAAGIFIYPQWLGSRIIPWRLGLDLVGGTNLVYEVDMNQVNASDRDSVMGGLRDVIERRVNLFGVSEPQVVTAKEGDSYRLIIELAGIKDVNQAIKMIGETPMLDFREVIEPPVGATSTPQQAQFIPTSLTGRYVKSAQVDFNSTTGAPQVNIQFTDEGAKIFEELTAKNVGKPLAIFLDNALIEMQTYSFIGIHEKHFNRFE